MARVIVHEIFPFKLKNGSVQVLEPQAGYQIVKREIAEALVASGRGVLDESDANYIRSPFENQAEVERPSFPVGFRRAPADSHS